MSPPPLVVCMQTVRGAERGAHAVIPPRKNAQPWKAVTAGALAIVLGPMARQRLAAQRGPSGIEISGPCTLATMERIPPPKSRRNQDALCETARPAPHGAGLRPSGGRVPGSCGRSERLHCARHPRHTGHGISLSGRRGSPAVSRFLQQSPAAIQSSGRNADQCLALSGDNPS